MRAYSFVALTVALTVYGQLILKARADALRSAVDAHGFLLAMFRDGWVLSGLGSALAASACWMLAIRDAPLSGIYPIMALTFVVVPLFAAVMFKEALGGAQLTGIVLIVVGVGLSARPG